jgi:hypothetical protein
MERRRRHGATTSSSSGIFITAPGQATRPTISQCNGEERSLSPTPGLRFAGIGCCGPPQPILRARSGPTPDHTTRVLRLAGPVATCSARTTRTKAAGQEPKTADRRQLSCRRCRARPSLSGRRSRQNASRRCRPMRARPPSNSGLRHSLYERWRRLCHSRSLG